MDNDADRIPRVILRYLRIDLAYERPTPFIRIHHSSYYFHFPSPSTIVM
jgi:hypothetical protein